MEMLKYGFVKLGNITVKVAQQTTGKKEVFIIGEKHSMTPVPETGGVLCPTALGQIEITHHMAMKAIRGSVVKHTVICRCGKKFETRTNRHQCYTCKPKAKPREKIILLPPNGSLFARHSTFKTGGIFIPTSLIQGVTVKKGG